MKPSFLPRSTILLLVTTLGCGTGLDDYPSGGPSHPDEAVLWSLVVLPDIQHYIGGVFGGSP